MMKKRTGIIAIILLIVFACFMLYTDIFGLGSNKDGSASNINLGLELAGGVSITYEADEDNPSQSDMDDTIYKMQQRVDNYSTEAQVYQEGSNRITIEIPGVSDANEILEDLGTPGELYFISQTDADGNSNYTYDSTNGGYVLTKTIDELKEDGSIVCEGTDVKDAEGVTASASSTSSGTVQYVVNLTFTKDGTEKFADATTTAYDNGESIAIYYDGSIVSAPTVQAAITDGEAQITGMSSQEEAVQLASFIRIGGLKLKLNEIRSNVVGAQLGQNAVKTSLIGGAVGLALVCIIMMLVYMVPGLIATIALILYGAIIVWLLNLFNVTLTLPGIAGIILSIGMAVDANVIIYSRIQEELSHGFTLKNAIKSGFKKARTAILDGNITTLIACAVLGALGTGTFKGFALTLAIGIILSMFTALVISKLLANAFYAIGFDNPKRWAREKKEYKYKFVRNRFKYMCLPALIIVVGIICMVVNGANGKGALNVSMDFVGGTTTTVAFNEDYSLTELEENVVPVVSEITGDSDVSVQKVVNSNDVIIRTRTLDLDERAELESVLEEKFEIGEEDITAESVSATVGKEMRNDAILAVIIAVVLMLLYIFIRFKDLRFAFSAIIALLHDVVIAFMAYAILRISIGGSFIAVMLTILGYSINSTIVIFDRIRENMRHYASYGDYSALVDNSINQTLTRSIYTNLTTFISILALYIIGVATIKDFTLPMMIGILAGACSSVFLTGPLWYMMKQGKRKPISETQKVIEEPEASEENSTDVASEKTAENKKNTNKKKNNKKNGKKKKKK